jgi:hypothetical protein
MEICQFELLHPNGRMDRMAVLSCGLNVINPKALLDTAVSSYVGYEGYNEFIEIHLDNLWQRIIISGLDELNYQSINSGLFPDVEIFTQTLTGKSGNYNGLVAILRGGLTSDRPIAYMNDAVSFHVNQSKHNQFIEITQDNPWVRVLLFDINSLEYELFNNQTINGNI